MFVHWNRSLNVRVVVVVATVADDGGAGAADPLIRRSYPPLSKQSIMLHRTMKKG
jgi:hypothetical protein